MTALEWLEGWAKARDWLMDDFGQLRLDAEWAVDTTGSGGDGLAEVGEAGTADSYTLTPHVAWLWAHAVDTGREVRRRCPDCEGDGLDVWWRSDDLATEPTTMGHLAAHAGPLIAGNLRRWSGPCPTCSATCSTKGYLDTQLARVVCGWAPRECSECLGRVTVGWHEADADGHCEPVECGACVKGLLPGDPTARTELLAAAYGLNPGLTDEDRARGPFGCVACMAEEFDAHVQGREIVVCGACSEPAEARVLRDYLETLGLTPADLTPEIALASGCKPQGVLGQALALWMGGQKCKWCIGAGTRKWANQTTGQTGRDRCSDCHGQGTALAAYVEQQIALESAASSIEDAASPIALGS